MKLSETRDILAYIEHLHDQLGEAYEALEKHVVDPRAHFLLDYLKAMEVKSARTLHGYSRESFNVTLREWEPAELDDRVVREHLKTLQHPNVGAGELLDAALEMANWFDAFYAELERASSLPEQAELFASMREHARQERNQLTRNGNSLADF
jgi:hypothetical protein